MATDPSDADVIVLGLGPGGEAVAETLVAEGRRVVGVDERLVGGECPYFACIPSKMVLRAAQTLAEAARVDALAGRATTRADYTYVADRIRDEATTDWDDAEAVQRFVDRGGVFVRGRGRLTGRESDGRLTVEVAGAEYRALDVVVATGTRPTLPPIDSLPDLVATGEQFDSPIWTNREALRAPRLPASLTIVGGGPVGCELAQGFARFGVAVTVVQRSPRLLPGEEPAASAVLAEVFAREGIDVRVATEVTDVQIQDDGRVRVETRSRDSDAAPGSITTDKLLFATGRRANLTDIGLDRVGLDPQVPTLEVDDHMRVVGADGTPVRGLHAVGDVTGRGPFTHVADWQARILSGELLGRPEPFGGYHGLARTTFTDPEVGRVGSTAAEARAAGLTVRTGHATLATDTRGRIHGPGNDGFIELVVDADADVLVGATVVAPGGGEILGLLTLAVHARVPVTTLSTMHYVFPTLHRTVLEALGNLG